MYLQSSNPFEQPAACRKLLLEHDLVAVDPRKYAGKSFMCVFFTRFCGVGCPFCFFKSAPKRGESSVRDRFSPQGVSRFIEFCNQANLGYVLVSGGGEPLNEKETVLRIIREVETDRIVLVTSGNWASTERGARRMLDDIEDAIVARRKPCQVVVRLSVSEGHSIKLGEQHAVNLLRIFSQELCRHPYLKMQIHTFRKDRQLAKVLEHFPDHQMTEDTRARVSDDEQVIKIIPKRWLLSLNPQFSITVGVSRIFESGLRPNLHEISKHKFTMSVFDEDLRESEDDNSAVVYNADGSMGLDWSVNYNGNICTWQNQVNDDQCNLYEDSYEEILRATLRDPITLSYIEKGRCYREAVIEEVSPRAVIRQKAISLRDYSGTILFEEEKTRLYYALRVLQDYAMEDRLVESAVRLLPPYLQALIQGTREELQRLYRQSTFSIVDQYKRNPFEEVAWRDLLELIRLGHYDLTEQQVRDAVSYFNQQVGEERYAAIHDVETATGEEVQQRFARRLMYMKPSAYLKAQQQSQEMVAVSTELVGV